MKNIKKYESKNRPRKISRYNMIYLLYIYDLCTTTTITITTHYTTTHCIIAYSFLCDSVMLLQLRNKRIQIYCY